MVYLRNVGKIRVMVVDDHPAFREGLARILQEEADLEVVATPGSGKAAVDLAMEIKPDVIVMDLSLPDMNGIEATKQIKAMVPEIAVLIVSVYSNRFYILASLRTGVSGYLLKNTPLAELIEAIRLVSTGNAIFNLKATKLRQLATARATNYPGSEKLLPREMEVISLVAKGMDNKDIANQLNITVRTVETHLVHIFRKLKVHSRTEAVLCGLREGPLTLENLASNHN